MLARFDCFGLILVSAAFMVGCGGGLSEQDRLKKMMNGEVSAATPVSGVVLVDGSPAEKVWIQVYTADGSKQIDMGGRTNTNSEGKFEFTTYRAGDGLVSGQYKLTFLGQHFNKKKGLFEGPDLLKGRYKDPKKSEIKLDVEQGKPQKDLKFELTTK